MGRFLSTYTNYVVRTGLKYRTNVQEHYIIVHIFLPDIFPITHHILVGIRAFRMTDYRRFSTRRGQIALLIMMGLGFKSGSISLIFLKKSAKSLSFFQNFFYLEKKKFRIVIWHILFRFSEIKPPLFCSNCSLLLR